MTDGRSVLENVIIESEEIKRILKGLDTTKAAVLDGINGRILRKSFESLSDALHIMFERSIRCSEIPEEWKVAFVVPIFKKGKRKEVDNYRPVSLTSLVVKIIGKFLKNQIQSYIDKNDILLDSQHCFSKGRSCQTNLLEFLDIFNR